MNLAIYYRVSTDKQDLDSQRVAIESWIAGLPQKPKSITVYKDEGISGSKDNRPGFQNMLSDARSGKFDTLVVYKLDRLTRSLFTALETILELERKLGVTFVSVTEKAFQLDNEFRLAIITLMATLSELERKRIIERVNSGLQAAKQKGIRLGAVPKLNLIDIQKIKDLRANGYSYGRISKELGISKTRAYEVVNG